ncbi:MAG: hypothetical protein ABSF43_03365 [Rectinemataceae bacterium]|jgi:hypothetical protein
MKRVLVYAALIVVLASCVSMPHGSVYLGEQYVPFKGERGTIDIGNYDGWFRAIYFKVERNDIELFNMVITYGNGEREKIDTRLVFDEGARSRIINLEGGKRHVRSVEFVYKTVGSWLDGRARIRIYGLR